MSKTKTLFTMALLVLLGLMGAAQAQIARIELLAQPELAAREGGKNEKAGDVWLDIDLSGELAGEMGAVESFTLTYSSPLATGLGVADDEIVLTGATLSEDGLGHAEGTIKITPATSTAERAAIQIEGVRLDVSMASAPVTVTLSMERSAGIAILTGPDTRNVIVDILPGVLVEVGVDLGTVRTRGTGTILPDTTVTLKPGFTGAWNEGGTDGAGMSLKFEVEGLPKGVKGMVKTTSSPADQEATDGEPAVDGAFAMSVPSSLTGDEDGNPQSLIITLGDTEDVMESVPTSVILTLMLDTSGADVQLPLQEGEIQARVTIADVGTADPDDFIDKFTSYMTIFKIRPAQCTMLFPVVTVMAPFSTVISITNPGYGEETADGSLEFTFYRQAIDGMTSEPVTYTTGPESPGSGLQMDGTLAAGGTYQAYISHILEAADWGETFVGHVMVTADYTGCTGLGWVTDFEKVNQAYIAVVIDSDTGKDDDK